MERLPGNIKNRLFTRSWTARVRLVHSWMEKRVVLIKSDANTHEKTWKCDIEVRHGKESGTNQIRCECDIEVRHRKEYRSNRMQILMK